MALFDPNNSDAFFESAMADLKNGHAQNLDLDDDEFADALEHQVQYETQPEDLEVDLPDTAATSGAHHQTYAFTSIGSLPFAEQSFQSNVGAPQGVKQIYTPSTRPVYYNPATEPVEAIQVNKTSASEKHSAAYHDILKQSSQFQQAQHTPNCSGSRDASAPPVTPSPATPPPATPPSTTTSASQSETKPAAKLEQKVWLGPDDLRDVAKPFLREKRWHEKVAHLHPKCSLASHRYWIGVLAPGQNPLKACKEEHFTWMKGNRLTTVETVRNVYTATTMVEGVFMMGGERPKDTDRVEELDLFNDNIVLFRIATEGTPAAVGRLITEGLVTKETEVIELDD